MSAGILPPSQSKVPSQTDMKRPVCRLILNITVPKALRVRVQADSKLAPDIDPVIPIIFHILSEALPGRVLLNLRNPAFFKQNRHRLFGPSDISERTVHHKSSRCLRLFNGNIGLNTRRRIPLPVFDYPIKKSRVPVLLIHLKISSCRSCHMDKLTVTQILHNYFRHQTALLCIHHHEIIFQHRPSVIGGKRQRQELLMLLYCAFRSLRSHQRVIRSGNHGRIRIKHFLIPVKKHPYMPSRIFQYQGIHGMYPFVGKPPDYFSLFFMFPSRNDQKPIPRFHPHPFLNHNLCATLQIMRHLFSSLLIPYRKPSGTI